MTKTSWIKKNQDSDFFSQVFLLSFSSLKMNKIQKKIPASSQHNSPTTVFHHEDGIASFWLPSFSKHKQCHGAQRAVALSRLPKGHACIIFLQVVLTYFSLIWKCLSCRSGVFLNQWPGGLFLCRVKLIVFFWTVIPDMAKSFMSVLAVILRSVDTSLISFQCLWNLSLSPSASLVL